MKKTILAAPVAAKFSLAAVGLAGTALILLAAPMAAQETSRWSLQQHTPSISADPPATRQGGLDLILDDGSREADVGVSDTTSSQFLWFNRFETPASGIDLDEIQVLFPSGPEIVPGAAIQLVLFTDTDGDPTTGADLLVSIDETIQVADGVTFSTYTLDPPLSVPAETPDILVGVVNRFVISGVSPPSRPAALDTSASTGRSWVALWTGDPPDPPELPPDDFLDLIDFVEPGNWMIRASGLAPPIPPVTEIPSLSPTGLAALALLLAFGGAVILRRDASVLRK